MCSNRDQVVKAIKENRQFVLDKNLTELIFACKQWNGIRISVLISYFDSGNGIDSQGAQYIAKALENNSSLTNLQLSCKMLMTTERMKCLELSCSNIISFSFS